MKQRIKTSIQILEDEMIVFGRQMYLLENKALKNEILQEAHKSIFATHPRSTMMY